MPVDSPRGGFGNLSKVPEEPVSPRIPVASGSRSGPYSNPVLSHSQSTFRAHASSNSLASLASSSAPSPVPPLPSTPSIARTSATRNIPNLRATSSASLRSDRDKQGGGGGGSDTASATGVSVSGVMGVSTPVAGKSKGRSNSPASSAVREKGPSSSSGKEGQVVAAKGSRAAISQNGPRVRHHPHLPTGNADPVPATLMYWSKAPVYGVLPIHGLRAHSVTLVDGMAWIFGGCDERGCWKDIWCFNTETMQWSNPNTTGETPPPCRAHTATLVDKKLVVFGGGEGPIYYNEVYVLDTVTRQWQHPKLGTPSSPPGTPGAGSHEGQFPPTVPPPRRAHTAVLYRGRIWIFGGGNGTQALNDLWTLEVGNNASVDKMKWELIKTEGKTPSPRGYHTANLVGNIMIVVGGSDGRECFSDIWCLNLESLQWSQVKLLTHYRRLSHTATQIGSYLFIWGGHDGSSYTSELLLFNLVALLFENRTPAGRAPSARGYHAAILTDGRLFIFGGSNGNDIYDDVHILDLAGAAYLPQVTSFRIDVE